MRLLKVRRNSSLVIVGVLAIVRVLKIGPLPRLERFPWSTNVGLLLCIAQRTRWLRVLVVCRFSSVFLACLFSIVEFLFAAFVNCFNTRKLKKIDTVAVAAFYRRSERLFRTLDYCYVICSTYDPFNPGILDFHRDTSLSVRIVY
jgi:hypothetical protein